MDWSQLVYPGRFVIVGQRGDQPFLIYGVTGRNPASKAKRYVYMPESREVVVEPTDMDVINQGDPDLLLYTAVRILDNAVVIGNGKQTSDVAINSATDAALVLEQSLDHWLPEPDKYFTPRITGLIIRDGNYFSAALNIIRQEGSRVSNDTFPLSLSPSLAYFISTYAGPNVRPTPSFGGSPIEIPVDWDSLDDLYARFNPAQGEEDLRVSLVEVRGIGGDGESEVRIINAIGRG